MLHNSLFHRDALRALAADPHVIRRRDVHRTVARRPGATAPAGSVALDDGAWAVLAAGNDPAERMLAKDAEDFLRRMGVDVRADAKRHVLLEIGSAAAGFRTVVSADRVDVHAADASSLWSGWVHLENRMREAGGPFLPAGETSREPAWAVQVAPPAWGANYAVPDLSPEYLPDDAFRSLAHAGASAMFVYGDFLLYARGTRFAEIEPPDAAGHVATLRDATERAAPFGIQLYFVAVSPKLPADHALFQRVPAARGARIAAPDKPLHGLCSSNSDALGFHADVFSRLFKDVPRLGGLICIVGGESYYHCFMRSAGSAVGETNCPNCKGTDAEEQIANFMKATADAVTSSQPRATVAAWPYSASHFWSREPNQLEFIDRLPPNVALLSEIDKEQSVVRGGVVKRIWDYSVDVDTPSDRIVSQALRCAKRDRKLFVKTETSYGIELLHLPYAPALTRSARQWQSVRSLRPAGVLQRWGFIGMMDSAAERIAFQARWDPDFAPDRAALAVARQLVGPDDAAAAQLVKAWGHFDDAVHHIPVLTTGSYYEGPAFLGPCHPLPTYGAGAAPTVFHGNMWYLAETAASLTDHKSAFVRDLTLRATGGLGVATQVQAEPIQAEFARARDAALAGHELLQSIKPDAMIPQAREELAEQQAVGEYLYRTFRAAVNVIHWLRLREGNVKDADARYTELARDELANAVAAPRVYEAAPFLNHKRRSDIGMNDSVAMVDEKVNLLEAFLAGR